MELVQLLKCSETLNNCCSSYVLANILDITKNIFSLIQLIVPIALIVAGTIQFIQLSINPEMKDGFRRVLNKFIAAFIIFMLPVIVDVIVGVIPNSVSVAKCWEDASVIAYSSRNSEHKYIEDDNIFIDSYNSVKNIKKSGLKLVIDPVKYITSAASNSNTTIIDDPNNPNKKVAEYAKTFVGKDYLMGGYWDGSPNYTATDCCGFVIGAYKHFGVNIERPCYKLWNNSTIAERVSENNLRAGDIVLYAKSGSYYHFAILTGNGEEIVEAKGKDYGVVISPTYKKTRKITGFVRIKGVK